MKVLIEARSLAAKSGGVRRYTEELIISVVEHGGAEYEVLLGRHLGKRNFSNIKQHVLPLAHDFLLPYWLQYQVPSFLKTMDVDLVHFTKADVPRRLATPSVVTVYDIIPWLLPRTQSFTRRFYWRGALARSVTESRHIFTISQAAARDLTRHFDVDENRITVTPLAVNINHFYRRQGAEVESVQRRLGILGPYILFVGTRDKRKNLKALISAWTRISDDVPHRLVIVGRKAAATDGSERVVGRLGMESRVTFLEDVSYTDLPAVYSGASVMVWPSIIEGWGLPPQEALACGTPVIVSDGDPLPEVVGSAGDVVPFSFQDLQRRFDDVDFIDRLAQRILEVLGQTQDPMLRLERVCQASKGTWADVASLTLEGYKKAVS